MADVGALARCVAGQVDPEKHPDLTAAWDEATVMDSMQGTRPQQRRGAAGSLGSSGIVSSREAGEVVLHGVWWEHKRNSGFKA